MNSCLFCGKDVKNKYCNTYCQNKQKGVTGSTKKEKIVFKKTCLKCLKEFEVVSLNIKNTKNFCSRKCANSRCHSEEVKNKISHSLKKPQKLKELECYFCKKKFKTKKHLNRKFCSHSCASKNFHKDNPEHARRTGKMSSVSQCKRSKNEILFHELCISKFEEVLNNCPMFNGWDADIILNKEKIAILWNGNWHYQKITNSHSLKQVQNRDLIKTKEIINCGFTLYIIKDDGKFNKNFVNKEFTKFLDWKNSMNL